MAGVAPGADPETRRTALLELAERAHAADDLSQARAAYSALLLVDPENGIARRGIAEVDAELAGLIRERRLFADRRLRLAVPVDAVPDTARNPLEAAILPLLIANEWLTVTEVLAHLPHPELSVMEMLIRLVDRGVISVQPA